MILVQSGVPELCKVFCGGSGGTQRTIKELERANGFESDIIWGLVWCGQNQRQGKVLRPTLELGATTELYSTIYTVYFPENLSLEQCILTINSSTFIPLYHAGL